MIGGENSLEIVLHKWPENRHFLPTGRGFNRARIRRSKMLALRELLLCQPA